MTGPNCLRPSPAPVRSPVFAASSRQNETIAGGARYIIVQPEKAEVALAVVDQYQGQGIGTALICHLATIARAAALRELIAEVLPENVPMLKAFQNSGLPMQTKLETAVVHVVLPLS